VAEGEQASVAELFKAFLRFYTEDFDWGKEVVSVRTGKRASRKSTGSSSGITIEDPSDAALDLGDCLTASSYKRLQEELVRAKALCARSASLSEVLELWAPEDGATASGATTAGAQAESGEE
jgi:hypothetical protein